MQAIGELVEMAIAFGVDEHAILLRPIRHQRIQGLPGVHLKFLAKALNHLARQCFQTRGDLAIERIELLREPLCELSLLMRKSLTSFGNEPGVFGV